MSNVVRIHTDAVTFRTRMEDLETVEDLKLEKKSTGLIIWKNVNAYTNLTLELKSFCDFYVAMRERNKKQNERFNQLI